MKKHLKNLWKYRELIIIALPTLILTFILKYLPLPGIYLAFVKFKPGGNFFLKLFKSKFVGFDNFRFVFFSNDIFTILRNTIGYNIIFIILGMLAAVFTAIMINEIYFQKYKKAMHTMMFLPYFMSWVAVSFMVYGFLSDKGLINIYLNSIGKETIHFYQDPTYWPYILVVLNIWKGIGYGSVLYLSALTSVDRNLYEAAVIDGATKWQQIKHITIPTLKPLIIVMLILSIGGILSSDFGLFYQIPKNEGILYGVTQTLDVYVFNTFNTLGDSSMSAAGGLFQSSVGFVLILIVNFIIKKIDKEKALF